MSAAVVFDAFGGPDVLHVIDRPLPVPGPGQVRLRVRAAGIQPFDAMFRSGQVRAWVPASFPQQLGNEAAGVVDAVGDGVTAFAVGDAAFGWIMLAGCAEHVVVGVDQLVAKPAGMSWCDAGVLSASGQTALTALEELRVAAGDTLLVHAAAGGVGSFAVQLARSRGATVIGTASSGNHDYLRGLGAVPVAYGPGLVDRVRALAPGGVTAALVAATAEEAFAASRDLVGDPQRRGAVAFHPAAEAHGVRRLTSTRSTAKLAALVLHHTRGELRIEIARTFSFAEAPEAHRVIETGHVRGKLVFDVTDSERPATSA